LNILFTSAGRRVSLVRLFRRALDELGVQGQTIAADLRRDAPASHVADVSVQVPRVSDPGYVDALLEICRRHGVRLLVPLIDTELMVLAESKARFEAAGVTPLVCSPETIQISADKRATHDFFVAAGVDTPRILDTEAILADPRAGYPFVLKPLDGSCSIGVTRVRNTRELAFFKDYVANAMVQELVPGEEYTLDILVDFDGAVRCVVPRLRMETRAGEVSKGMTVRDPEIIAAGRAVAEALPGAVGCITAQCFKTPGETIRFIEINPRFGGGFPLAAEAGADFPRWILEMLMGHEPKITLDGWRDGVVMLRYDDAVFCTREDVS